MRSDILHPSTREDKLKASMGTEPLEAILDYTDCLSMCVCVQGTLSTIKDVLNESREKTMLLVAESSWEWLVRSVGAGGDSSLGKHGLLQEPGLVAPVVG